MCTLTFLPGLPGDGYLLATNRDESPRRGEALPPFVRVVCEQLVIAPADRDAGGTWIAADDRGACLALLNGDMPPGAPPPARPVSRGLLVLELIEDARPEAVRATLLRRRRQRRLPFRPFKLVAVEAGSARAAPRLLLAQWDGATLSFSETKRPCCIVSSTSRPRAAAAARGATFGRFLAGAPQPSARGLASALAGAQRRFQASHSDEAPDGGPLTPCMHRKEARTISSTQVCVTRREVMLRYQPGWPCEGRPAQVISVPRRHRDTRGG